MVEPFESPSRKPLGYGGGVRRPDGAYAVPRRYSIGMVLVVTAAFALLLTVLREFFDFTSAGALSVFLFFAAVGVGQSVLFGGRRPRWASMLCGQVALPTATLFLYLQQENPLRFGLLELVCGLVFALVSGAGAGYLAGGLIGGVFLLCDRAMRAFGAPGAPPKAESPFADAPPESNPPDQPA